MSLGTRPRHLCSQETARAGRPAPRLAACCLTAPVNPSKPSVGQLGAEAVAQAGCWDLPLWEAAPGPGFSISSSGIQAWGSGLGHGYQGTPGPCCWGSTGHPELPLTTSRQPNTFQQPLAPHPGSAERSRAWPGRAFLSPVEFPQPHRDQQQEEALPEEVPSTRQVACGHCSHG